MSPWLKLLCVAVGGALGASARYLLTLGIGAWTGHRFPWATLSINLAGAFALGFLAEATVLGLPAAPRRLEAFGLLAMTGLLGGFTTFSTFTLEAVRLARRPSPAPAILYVALSVLAGLAFCLLGLSLARLLIRPVR